MIEIPGEGQTENQNQQNEVKDQVSSSILKLFFKKQMEKGNESSESGEQEININIQGSIKGPDKFGNYVMSFDGKKILLNENLEDITGMEFVGIMPYNDRYYICDIGKECIFFDSQKGDLIEFTEHGDKVRPVYYKKNVVCHDEFLNDLCEKSVKLFSGENEKIVTLAITKFLESYRRSIKNKDIDLVDKMDDAKQFSKEIESLAITKFLESYRRSIKYKDIYLVDKMNEAKQFSREIESLFSFLMGAFEYMYNGKITGYLSGKDCKLREELKDSEILKETFPDLYLAMRELDFIKNVLVDKNGKICGYVAIEHGKCCYITNDGTISVYDDFIGPDKYGNIITIQGNKKYFMNTNFQYPFCGFDDIIGPDKYGNYILKFKNKMCLVSVGTGKILNISGKESIGNEPNFTSECFDSIQEPDKNHNYLINSGTRGYFLASKKGEKISDMYLSIDGPDEKGNYKTLNMSGSFLLDKDGKLIK